MDNIIDKLINNLDFNLMLTINIITYGIIKIIDNDFKNKNTTTWQKRIIFIIVCFTLSFIAIKYDNMDIMIVINSCVFAPVSWSWIFKPIFIKLGIDYKQIN